MMMNKKRLGLYLHIPFCARKCLYCDFLSGPASDEVMETYAKALSKEIGQVNIVSDYEVDSIFFGGGTPSVMKECFIDSFFEQIHAKFKMTKKAEITMECNPGTVTSEKLQSYRRAGVNRLSFGLQSTNNKELKLLGRIHSWEDFLHSYELARKCGYDNINIDLMASIPGQTRESYANSCNQVIALEPEHISAYSLIIEEGTPFYEKYHETPPVDEELDRILYADTKEILHQSGYERYEISNYAKEGFECRHNMKYWSMDEYLGLGVGASSYLNGARFSNVSDVNKYCELVQQGKHVVDEYHLNQQIEDMEEFIFLGLRKTKGISIEEFRKIFGITLQKEYGKTIETLKKEGTLDVESGYIKLTEYGLDVSNYVMSQFIHDKNLK